MTLFHYDNYGTVLQAAALRHVLQSYGHSVDVISYYPGERVLTVAAHGRHRQAVRGFLQARMVHNPNVTTTVSGEAFNDYRRRNLTFTFPCETLTDLEQLNEQYDAFVCGSDRIWLPMFFDPRFYLDFVQDPERMIAYAPSILPTPGADTNALAQMKALIARFKHLSVREESGRKFLEEKFEMSAPELADPTLLIEPDEWDGALQIPEAGQETRERYMLVLFRNPSRAYQDAAAKLAGRLLLKLIIVPIHESDLKQEFAIKDPVGPDQLISLLRNADYVCTDSYHGTALAISFQKEFCCFDYFTDREMYSVNRRVHDLLDALGLQSRLYSSETSIEQYIKPIDFIPVNYKLDALKGRSRQFLREALQTVASYSAMHVKAPGHVLQGYGLCSGCGACAAACPHGAVRVEPSEDGFLRAVVSQEKCVRCETCRQVCPFEGTREAKELSSGRLLSYRDEEKDFPDGSHAGGAAARLAWLLKSKGYAVAGCAMDEETGLAVHKLVYPDEVDEKLEAFRGIKLMTSSMTTAYVRIKDMDEEIPLALFGTPCQIAGARAALKDRKDVIYIEVACSGVPTTLLRGKKYRSTLRGRFGEDMLLRALQSGLFYNEACYSCRWRKSSEADIRIGDLSEGAYPQDRKSSLLIMTERGSELINDLMISGYWEGLRKQDIHQFLDRVEPDNPPMPVFYEQAFEKIRDEKVSLNRILKEYVRPAGR